MADMKTHLRELSVATTIGLLTHELFLKNLIYTMQILF